jgi:hypothetical protein
LPQGGAVEGAGLMNSFLLYLPGCCSCLISLLAPAPTHPPAESYAALSRQQVALVAEEACRAHARLVQHIKHMAEQQPLPEPSY